MNKWLSDKEWQCLHQETATAEKNATLTPAQLEICFRYNWFNLFVPRSLGGLELALPEALRLEETLAEVDGSLGWTVTLCAGAAWFAGFLNPAQAQEIFSNPKVCIGGSGAATGTAKKENGGYRISGQWRFATGAPHLTHFTANCQITDEQDQPLLNEDGSRKVLSFIFKKEEVEIIADWRAMGLMATASHSFLVDDLWVKPTRSFLIDSSVAKLPGLVYQYPFLSFAAATLAVNYSGMARHFFRLAGAIFTKKNELRLLEKQQQAVAETEQLRKAFYAAVEDSWKAVTSGNVPDEAASGNINRLSAQLADLCIRKVDLLFPHCGMTGADTTSEINIVWRDLHTASQHGLLRQMM